MIKKNFRSLRWDSPGKAANVLMALLFSVTAPADAVEIIKDNSDSSGITIAGPWLTSSSIAGYHGSNYLHDNNTSKGTASVTFTPTIPQTGSYLVYAKWTESWQRSVNVPYIIQHSGGSSTVAVDQTTNGGKWHLLGTYTFAAGTGGNVKVSNAGTEQAVVADAVRFVSVDDAVANAIVMDNGSSTGVTLTGSWTASTAEVGFFEGTNYIHDGNTGKGAKKVTFRPTIAVSSHHHVYIKTPGHRDYAGNTPVTINHNRGSTTVTVDQQINTGRWTYLGCFGFNQGNTGTLEISNTGTTGNVVVDAVKFVPTTNEIIQDAQNTSGITITGSWAPGTTTPGFYGTDYLGDGDSAKGSKSVRFSPLISQAGYYEVFTRWTSGDNRADGVPIEILHSGGTTSISVDQRDNGGRWISLGLYNFNAGSAGNVLISNAGTEGHVVVDAVRFVRQVILDNSAAMGVDVTGTWTAANSVAGYMGSNYLHDENDFKGSRSVRFSPTVPEAGRYDVFARWTEGSNRASNARYYITSAGGTSLLEVDQRTNGGEWVFLGNYAFHSGSSANILVSNTGTNGYVIADSIRLAPSAYVENRVSVTTPSYTSNVSGNTWIQVVAPGFTSITAKCWQGGTSWGSDRIVAEMDLDSRGNASFLFRADDYPHGPITLRITGTKGTASDTCYLQLYNTSGTPWNQGIPAGSPSAGLPTAVTSAGVTQLVFADDFNAMPSITSNGIGATYSARKHGPYGAYSQIPFADPTGYRSPFSQVGTYLKITADAAKNSTGLISSIRSDGTGVKVKYPAYFECRFIASSSQGTWPQFWLLTYGNAFDGVPIDELDIIEAYGGEGPNEPNAPRKYNITAHNWGQVPQPASHFRTSGQTDMTLFGGGSGWMFTPHTYGCLITDTDVVYYLDNIEVRRHSTNTVSKTDPFFFLVDLAVGSSAAGGWPVDLSRYNGLSDMYIDYIRVFKKP